jgi:hypothetical protein
MGTGSIYYGDNIRNARATSDGGRMTVHHAVPDASRLVITVLVGQNQLSRQGFAQFSDGLPGGSPAIGINHVWSSPGVLCY